MTDYLETCINKLTDDQIWSRGAPHENSVGNLILHLCGNMRQWIGSGVGGEQDIRDRPTEFSTAGGLTAAALLAHLKANRRPRHHSIIDAVTPARLVEEIHPQNRTVTVLEAIYQVVTHFHQHTGQVIFATKIYAGEDLGLYPALTLVVNLTVAPANFAELPSMPRAYLLGEVCMQNLLGNIRYSLRQFRLSPVFTITAVLTLALGIGGTTAIFTLIHAVMLRSLPVADPASLYRIGDGNDCCVEGGPQDRWGMFSYPLYQRLKAAVPEFDEVAAFQAGADRLSVRREGSPAAAQSLRSEFVTGNYFQTLGIGALGGRVFTPADDQASAAPVVVISHHVWETTYGADPHVLGATFVIEGHPFTVVGVTPPGFYGETLRSDPPEVWIPVQQEPVITGAR